MSTFVLVHGAWHGAWCWDRLVPELRALGHDTIAMDLPVEDGDATFDDYAGVVLSAMDGAGDDAVLVGHSLGAMTAPLVAARRSVNICIFLCGIVPKPGGFPWEEDVPMEDDGAYDALARHEDGSTSWPTVEAVGAAMYHDCPSELAAWAFSRLRPQNSASLWDRPYPLASWPEVSWASIYAQEDRAVSPAWSRYVAEVRLGVEAVPIAGSHSPFLSRPADLAALLAETVHRTKAAERGQGEGAGAPTGEDRRS
jgi:pimeloyl-ACP methyl ester carboxylesterase